jgi:hypothetical protein
MYRIFVAMKSKLKIFIDVFRVPALIPKRFKALFEKKDLFIEPMIADSAMKNRTYMDIYDHHSVFQYRTQRPATAEERLILQWIKEMIDADFGKAVFTLVDDTDFNSKVHAKLIAYRRKHKIQNFIKKT